MNAVLALARRKEDEAQRERRRGQYRQTTAFQEASLFRVVVKRSYLPRNEKGLLLSFVNRWFRHSKPERLAITAPVLMKAMGWARNTLRTALRSLVAAGFIKVLRLGNGRGNVTEYFVDLPLILEKLDPNGGVRVGEETVTFSGEIKASGKGSNAPRAYKEHHTMQRWRPLVFLTRGVDPLRKALSLLERLAQNLTHRPDVALNGGGL